MLECLLGIDGHAIKTIMKKHRTLIDGVPIAKKGFGPMKVNFELNPYYHIGRLHN